MFNNIFLKTLRDKRKALLGWGLGILALSIWYDMLFKVVEGIDLSGMNKLMEMEAMRGLFGGVYDLTTPVGWLAMEMLPLLGPIIFIAFTASFANSELAGEEERGTLDILLSGPISRSSFIIQKFSGMVVGTIFLGAVFWVSHIIGTSAAGMDISYLSLAQVSFSLVLLGLTFGSLALALGGLTGVRNLSVGLVSVVGFVSYLLNSMSEIVDALKPFRPASVFHYYDGAGVLQHGINFFDVGVLLAGILALLLVGLYGFKHRNIGT